MKDEKHNNENEGGITRRGFAKAALLSAAAAGMAMIGTGCSSNSGSTD